MWWYWCASDLTQWGEVGSADQPIERSVLENVEASTTDRGKQSHDPFSESPTANC